MPLQKPSGVTQIQVPGLGTLQGRAYANNIRQFCGIPYANLAKRWTRATLNGSWPNSFHDGTKLGCAAPNPREYRGDTFLLPIEHGFDVAEENEFECLNMNIAIPPQSNDEQANIPVMVYIHGGSFLFGGAQRPVYDAANLVSHSVKIGSPVIAVNFNYRVGIGGFLASGSIRDDLEKDLLPGAGNFGLTDQQTALEWVQRHIEAFGGDKHNVTLYGESAGGMSVDHQINAATPAIFHRAILMSGLLNTIPTWSLDDHDRHYQALLQYLEISNTEPDALETLRKLPHDVVANAATAVAGVVGATGNPCDDGSFHTVKPSFNLIGPKPAFLKSLMVGDVYHEGIIFHETIAHDDYDYYRSTLIQHIGDGTKVDRILELFNIRPETPPHIAQFMFEDLAGDALFKTPNYLNAHVSKTPQTYGYHFDQRSTLDNPVKGTAYHALDLIYLFLNMQEKMTPAQWDLARSIATAWIEFAYGRDPWQRFSVGQQWMVFGPDDKVGLKSEKEDEDVRQYTRMKEILNMGIYEELVAAVDEIATKRPMMGKFSGIIGAIPIVPSF